MFKIILVVVVCLVIFAYPVDVRAENDGTLIIESIGLYKPIYFIPLTNRQYDLTQLGYGVARLEDTSWNDTAWGRTVIVGHTPGGFQDLTNVLVGDRIIIMTDLYVMEYIVYDISIVNADANPRDWFTPTDTPTLLLQTCYGEDRLMVEASLESYH